MPQDLYTCYSRESVFLWILGMDPSLSQALRRGPCIASCGPVIYMHVVPAILHLGTSASSCLYLCACLSGQGCLPVGVGTASLPGPHRTGDPNGPAALNTGLRQGTGRAGNAVGAHDWRASWTSF